MTQQPKSKGKSFRDNAEQLRTVFWDGKWHAEDEPDFKKFMKLAVEKAGERADDAPNGCKHDGPLDTLDGSRFHCSLCGKDVGVPRC